MRELIINKKLVANNRYDQVSLSAVVHLILK